MMMMIYFRQNVNNTLKNSKVFLFFIYLFYFFYFFVIFNFYWRSLNTRGSNNIKDYKAERKEGKLTCVVFIYILNSLWNLCRSDLANCRWSTDDLKFLCHFVYFTAGLLQLLQLKQSRSQTCLLLHSFYLQWHQTLDYSKHLDPKLKHHSWLVKTISF